MVAIDMSAAKAPPKRPGRPRQTQVQVPQPVTQAERRAEGLEGLAQLGQGICLAFGLYADAATIGKFGGPVCRETANLAESYEWVAKPVDFLIEVGPFGAFIAAVAPMTLQIMVNHGMIDAAKLSGQGVVPPEVLESQMMAQVARMQALAMREHQAALAEAQEAQREYAEFTATMNTTGNGVNGDSSTVPQ